jgi:predicted acyl esterase
LLTKCSYHDEVNIQKSFLDAFLKDQDSYGWTVPGKVSPVTLTLRKGNVGFNDAAAESQYAKREETAWPLPSTKYMKYHLGADNSLALTAQASDIEAQISYSALGSVDRKDHFARFETQPFAQETEITGHVQAHLNVSMTPDSSVAANGDKDIDLFVTLRYIDPSSAEVLYTGTAGDGVPLTKGWLRCSMRKIHTENPRHREYMPHREYLSTDVQEVQPEVVYGVDVEVWPTNVVVEKGGKIVFEVASGDTQGCGIFQHDSCVDRPESKFKGVNILHFGKGKENYVMLPVIPPR